MMKRWFNLSLVLLLLITLLPIESVAAETNGEVKGKDLLNIFMDKESDFSSFQWMGEWEYSSKNGKSKRNYASNLKKIDGLTRTKKKITDGKPIDSAETWNSAMATNVEDYPFEGDYEYLYFNKEENLLRPIASKERYVFINGTQWQRSIFITQISEEAMQLLHETNTYRFTDNLTLVLAEMGSNVFYGMDGYCGARILKPTLLTDETLTVEATLIPKPVTWTQKFTPYHKSLNGYLLQAGEIATAKNYDDIPTKKKTIVLKRESQNTVVENMPTADETKAESTLALFQSDTEDFSDVFYEFPAYEFEYASEDGKITQYYVSYLGRVDTIASK